MPKEKSLNPVQAHNKALKRAEHKKSKAAVAAQRQERLSKRDPARLERQIASLKEQAALRPREKELLAALERDLALVRKARGGRSSSNADEQAEERRGKRRREEESGSDTDEDVRRIPMPRDTPPPMPAVKKPERKVEAQLTYSSAPVMRDLKKEATAKGFAPAAVKRNVQRLKGGGLLEEEELDRLEQAGYAGDKKQAAAPRAVQIEDAEEET